MGTVVLGAMMYTPALGVLVATRLRRTPGLAHGAINASGGAVALFVRAGTHFDTALVAISGVTGWILPLLVIGVLVAMRRLPVRRPALSNMWDD